MGLAFGAVHLVHLATLLALAAWYPEPFVSGLNAVTLVGGGLVYAFVIAMMLTSTDRAQRALGRAWTHLHRWGGWYTWLIFLRSYLNRVAAGAVEYTPLALLFLAVLALRITAHRRATARSPRSQPAPRPR